MDTILIIDGRAHEIWRAKTIEQLRHTYHTSVVDKMVEQPAGLVNEGDVWSAEEQTFASSEP